MRIETFDPSNSTQLANWDGVTGAFWADNADRFDRGVAAYRELFLEAAAIEETHRVLDVGCGTGQTTRDTARAATAGAALGVDLSSRMLDLARERAAAEHVTNVTFQQADAQVHPFAPHSFDLAISRHGAMFFCDPVAAFTNIARSLRPGGRLILLTWQSFVRNKFMSEVLTALAAGRQVPAPPTDGPSPVSLSDSERVQSLLALAGFTDVQLQPLHRPMYLGADPEDAFAYVTGQHAAMLRDIDPDTKTRALDNLRASLTQHNTGQGVLYDSAAWLIQSRKS